MSRGRARHRADPLVVAGRLRADAVDQTPRLHSDDAVLAEPDVALEVLHRGLGLAAELAVDAPGVGAGGAQSPLKAPDGVALRVVLQRRFREVTVVEVAPRDR